MTIAPAIPLPPLTRVAVVGAGGPSGLVAVRQLLEAGVRPDQILACEARAGPGGVWNYEPTPGEMHVAWRKDGPPLVRSKQEIEVPGSNGPSAMYDRLRTNLPNKIMMYRGSPFPKWTPVFPTHEQVLSYLQDYAKDKGLLDVIQWRTRVLSVYHTPGASSSADRWTVETEHAGADGISRASTTVSHVIVSNGHYNEPFLPPISGLDTFEGKIVHSRWWRNPTPYRGCNIVVVGSHASGSDIARELATDDMQHKDNPPRTIYESVRGYEPGDKVWDDDLPWARPIRCVPEIKRVEGKTLHFVNGDVHRDIDVIVFATGYLFSYPFLTKAPFDTQPVTSSLAPPQDGLPPAGGQNILNLNNTDTFYVPDPTMAFIGLHYAVNPFPLGEATARLIARSFTAARVPPLPPLKRLTDDPTDKRIGNPAEFDNQDAWLEAIGEGGDDGGPNHGWPRTSDEVREARTNGYAQRKALLGY